MISRELSTIKCEVKTLSDPNCKKFRVTDLTQFDSIISYLKAKHGDNVQDKWIAEVRSG
jgi:hypothetical protein